METKQTSNSSWQASLAQTLSRLKKTDAPPRVAVVGIGQSLRGDDGAGGAVARLLQMGTANTPGLLVIDAGAAPENQVGPLRRFGPDLVLLVDAAQMDAAPGAVRWLAWPEAQGFSASSHTLPASVLAGYLSETLGCEVRLLGLQPATDGLDSPFSMEMWEAVVSVAQALQDAVARLN